MSPIPFGGWRIVPNYEVSKSNADYYWGMGLTAEAVANDFKVSREDQDAFSLASHQKAVKAIEAGKFSKGIAPITVEEVYLDQNEKRKVKSTVFATDEGPRADTDISKLAKLKPVFAVNGSVTAGNSSQTSDGAAFVLLMSERLMVKLGLKPKARLIGYGIAGLEPRIMGVGPIYAIPKALEKADKKLHDIDLIELNEAFASQSLAIVRHLGIDTNKLNVNGGAIALGHPLGCTGAKLTVQLLNELESRNQRFGMVTMCVGTGQGAAGVFERF
jgi:acetyl-CoA acyltransferase